MEHVTRVMVVATQSLVAKNLQRRLRRLGYDAFLLTLTGEASINKAIAKRPDLVLMDVASDDLAASLQGARQIGDHLRVPLVFVADASSIHMLQASQASNESFSYLLKPFTERELGLDIELVLHKHKTACLAALHSGGMTSEGSEGLLRAVFDGAPVPAAYFTTDGRCRFSNKEFKRLTGFQQADDESGLHIDELIAPEDGRRARARMELLLEEGGIADLEYSLVTRSGERIQVEARAVSINDSEGGPAGMLVVYRDLKERQEDEEARSARELAETSNRAKNEFLSRMSHELRTPLNAILGFGQLLEMDGLDQEQSESVGHIMKAGRHLLDLINEILDVARIEEGRISLTLEPIALGTAIEESVALVRPMLAANQLKLSVNIKCADELYVQSDRQRLKQVLLNLLSNAIKYNQKGGHVELTCDEAPYERVRITVADTGPGIGGEKVGRLFTPYERLGAEKSGIEGTGLGLVLAKRLVEAMGGEMGVQSKVGEGSHFWIELVTAESPEDDLGWLTSGPLNSGYLAHRKFTVLYVEDNESNLRLVERLFAHRKNVRLLSAMHGAEGLIMARGQRPDIILLDLDLPDMKGDAVLVELQADEATKNIPVTIVSADATPKRMEQLLALGAKAYLTKPLNIKHLLKILEEYLSAEQHRAFGE